MDGKMRKIYQIAPKFYQIAPNTCIEKTKMLWLQGINEQKKGGNKNEKIYNN